MAGLWIDADPVSRPDQTADIDDVLAIRMLVNAGVKVIGLSTVPGNGSEETVRESAAHEFPGLPRYPGSGSPGCSSPAVAGLLAASHRKRLTVLALGPLTNIAAAIRCDPGVPTRIGRVVAVAGRSRGERFSLADRPEGPVLSDLNYETDRGAFRDVLNTGIPVDLVGFAAGNRIRLSYGDLARLPPHLGDRAWSWTMILWFAGGGGTMPAFDQTAAALLLWPGGFICRPVAIDAGAHLIWSVLSIKNATNVRTCLPGEAGAIRQAIIGLTY